MEGATRRAGCLHYCWVKKLARSERAALRLIYTEPSCLGGQCDSVPIAAGAAAAAVARCWSL